MGGILNSRGVARAYDEDCGGAGNFRAQATVAAGVNYIRVSGSRATGEYALSVQLLDPSPYNIDLCYVGEPPSAGQQAAFDAAAAFWMRALIGDLPNVRTTSHLPVCDVGLLLPGAHIDDMVVLADLVRIDGSGATLGEAGACIFRSHEGGSLPVVGFIELDTADLGRLETNGALVAVVIHEMAHALGFGVLWDEFGLLQNPAPEPPDAPPLTPPDTRFSGDEAKTKFEEIHPTYPNDPKAGVPVENDEGPVKYGPGGVNVHWRESVLGPEIMTPALDISAGALSPVSRVTIASFADLGYEVNYDAAETFVLASARAARLAEPRPVEHLGDDVWRGPVLVVDEEGRVVRVIDGE